ncbi:hypothetical protein GGR51DRAFT_573282 [Nemania sp. FL0031]|nr:hypothetical protein GGR51DRAFT_573282 [Nemania sp. FL0031]
MSPPQDRIPSVGLHVLYEPEKSENKLVDIVFIHGFGGHPVRSWQYDGRSASFSRPRTDPTTGGGSVKLLRKRTRSADKTRRLSLGSMGMRNLPWQDESNKAPVIFWPRDLLPIACPEARIMTWGYHTLRSGNVPVFSQPDLFSHVNDLLRELGGLRQGTGAQQRPLIFIAHSLGGIIVKEILRQAELSNVKIEQDMLSSTAATIFFGCPHRAIEGEPLAVTTVSIAEAFLSVRTESSVLSALCGVNSPRWDEAQEVFVRLWHHFNFVVKTYQEKYDNTNKSMNTRTESCKLGDGRENAEILPGDHRAMCQFKSTSDEGFISLSKILRNIVKDEKSKRRALTVEELNCLRRLISHHPQESQPSMIGSSLSTCKGICSTREFCDWYRRRGGSNEHILWLTGAPGSGKTTQLRHIRSQLQKQWKPATTSVIYCTAASRSLDRASVPYSKLGTMRSATTIRSLLSQLFVKDMDLRQRLSSLGEGSITNADLTRFFLDEYIINRSYTLARRTFILIDAEDGCDDAYIQELLYCLCRMARNSDYSVCLASRPVSDHIPENVTQLELENHNLEDITFLVQCRLSTSLEERSAVVKRIAQKAEGSFLWAQIATNLVNRVIDDGGGRDIVRQTLDELPPELYGLYEQVLGSLSSKDMADATTIMRWVILAPESMVLNDLRMAVRLGRTNFLLCCDPQTTLDVGSPWSMQELQKTGKHFDTPSQFYQWLCSRTCGLLEARPADDEGKAKQSLGLQHVYPINDSVRSFFLSGRGFASLSSGRATTTQQDHEAVDLCHYGLLRTILIYLNTSDLSPLVSGHRSPEPKQGVLSPESLPTWRKNVVDQRHLITSSYPFLGYAVDNLLYHLLSPWSVRYFLPQQAIFNMFASNDCRIWRRWTAFLGETDALAILSRSKSAEALLQPEFGASFRLERVFRAVNKLANGESWFSPRKSLEPLIPPMPIPSKGEDEIAQQKHTKAPGLPSLPLTSRVIRRGPRSRGTMVMTRRRYADQNVRFEQMVIGDADADAANQPRTIVKLALPSDDLECELV